MSGTEEARTLCAGSVGSPNSRSCRRHSSAPKATKQAEGREYRKPWCAGEGGGEDQELAHEHAEWRQSRDRKDSSRQADGKTGMGDTQSADSSNALGILCLRHMAYRKEDRRFGQAVHGHVQEPREIGQGPAHAKSESDEPHVLDGRVGKQPFDVAPLVQHECGKDQRDQTHDNHDGAGINGLRMGGHDHLETQERIERHIEQQP